MKNILFICALLLLTSCEEKRLSYYHGVVVDENSNPLDSVMVSEVRNIKYPQAVLTKKDGTFKLYGSYNYSIPLLFSKKSYIIQDSVYTSWSDYGGEIQYRFLNKIKDTLVLKKIYLKKKLKTTINFKELLSTIKNVETTGNKHKDWMTNHIGPLYRLVDIVKDSLIIKTTSYEYKDDLVVYIHDLKHINNTVSIKKYRGKYLSSYL